ncbi:hypothetical protein P7K49_000396 [Saguinus oedipus]|uniref:Uncharacterized protein n=1 Tax=Saguinus oedipus TaxID=9490 RepID=A0ABQ9WC53_SAGOE|nr:hypothetical protein P7K49_000396 [Saguinus oedipus]
MDPPGTWSLHPCPLLVGDSQISLTAKSAVTWKDPSVNFLKNTGESVAGTLSPLGMEVDIDMEKEGKRSCWHSSLQIVTAQNGRQLSSKQLLSRHSSKLSGNVNDMPQFLAAQMKKISLESMLKPVEQKESNNSLEGDGDFIPLSSK